MKLLANGCAYIPLVKVVSSARTRIWTDALKGPSKSLHHNSIDEVVAFPLLPNNTPMSYDARLFLIPELVNNELNVHRLATAASLLCWRYI